MNRGGIYSATPNTPNPRKGTETDVFGEYSAYGPPTPNTPNPRKGTETRSGFCAVGLKSDLRIPLIPARGRKPWTVPTMGLPSDNSEYP